MTDVVLELPESLRSELKEPLGSIYTDGDALLEAAGEPIISVGDVVTYHLIEAGYTPAVALVDERTERNQVAPEISQRVENERFDREISVHNPAATVTAELVDTLSAAMSRSESTLIEVDGEEDLAALPAVMLAPAGASIVYGQPGEGMVLGTVDEDLKLGVRNIISQMDGDTERFFDQIRESH
ncbi:GTP-dependent dephospho-CoA kinase family protein [Halovenus salina]|uniref:GTP-dependent dephospho-CoA kinase n=1 Tax=Halovenus salina TaxID=1510225 RepID=A0ABD5W2E7_9EURY|nr:GTP-dependent dephospho-CoA kinase family protein [Halovenus salina]